MAKKIVLLTCVLILLASCQKVSSEQVNKVNKNNIEGCYFRNGDISSLPKEVGGVYGSKAELREFICFKDDQALVGSYVKRLEQRYVEEVYRLLDIELQKQRGLSKSSIQFDESKIISQVDESKYNYVNQETNRAVGLMTMKNGMYRLFGKMVVMDELMESVYSRGQYRLAGDILTLNQTEAILGFDKLYSNGSKSYQKASISEMEDIYIQVQRFYGIELVSKAVKSSDYFDMRQYASSFSQLKNHQFIHEGNKIDDIIAVNKKLQDISHQVVGLVDEEIEVMYLWQDSIYLVQQFDDCYVEWMISEKENSISVVNYDTDEMCKYNFDDLSEAQLGGNDMELTKKCTNQTKELATETKGLVDTLLTANGCTISELIDYISK